jgi:hypothetical protein
MFRIFPVLTALALVSASGLVYGLWTARWQKSDELVQALARVPEVPHTLAGWKGHDLDVDTEAFHQARAEAYWMRRYEKNGEAISVILMCGRAGPLAVHTPDVCYRGAGYEMVGRVEPLTVDVPGGASAAFWTARFQKERPGETGQLRLLWSWSHDGTWQAPTWPRLTFAGAPFLYKLYVIRETTSADEPRPGDPTLALLGELLPALDRTLFRRP